MFSVCRHWRKHPKDPKKTERETIYIRIDLVYHHMKNYIYVQVEPGKPGAEVSKKKNYKSKKKFAYRMCTG